MKLILAMAEADKWPHELRDDHVEQIKAVDASVDVVVARGEAAIHEAVVDADAVAGFPLRLAALPEDASVRWIHSFSAGVDKILIPAVVDNDAIVVSNSSGIHAIPIAEHVLGCMLAHTRNFYTSFVQQQAHEWHWPGQPGEVYGKTVLIVGLGAIGGRTAELAHALGATVRGVVRTKREAPTGVTSVHTRDELPELLPEADFVVIALPGGPQTEHYFDHETFSLLKSSATIINIGRGTIIKQDDLIEVLEAGRIGAAYLDVTTPEPLPADDPLWTTKNAYITAHYSGLSEKYMDRAVEQLGRNLRAFLDGESLPNQVDKALGY